MLALSTGPPARALSLYYSPEEVQPSTLPWMPACLLWLALCSFGITLSCSVGVRSDKAVAANRAVMAGVTVLCQSQERGTKILVPKVCAEALAGFLLHP